MILSQLFSVLSTHDVEVTETLIGVINFLLIFLAARTLAEVLVRFNLPTIVGELLAGVLIGASGFHLLIPPTTGAHLKVGKIFLLLENLCLIQKFITHQKSFKRL